MSASHELVNVSAPRGGIPIARMRSLYRVDDVGRKLDKLPHKEHENLRSTYERMIELGPERFQVKPSGLPVMDHLYDDLPNFYEVLDDVKRQLALCQDSRDGLEITPMLLLGPPGIGKMHFGSTRNPIEDSITPGADSKINSSLMMTVSPSQLIFCEDQPDSPSESKDNPLHSTIVHSRRSSKH